MEKLLIEKKKRKHFNILREVKELKGICDKLPDDDECYNFLSDGGFSSVAFVKFVADRARIKTMFASTLRIGRKHLWILDELRRVGKLEKCYFVVGSVMKNDSELGKSYKYYDDLEKVCGINNWSLTTLNNHSKIFLFDTEKGKFVLETSSNLKENPNIEQFSFEKCEELFEFYKQAFVDLMGVEL